MTVAELIEKLKEYPQDIRVVVRGYEDGVDDVERAEEIEIYLNYFDSAYCGEHREVISNMPEDYEKVPAIYLRY